MKWIRTQTTLFKIVIIILFALSLTSFRILWINHFQHEKDQPLANEGEIDLREWDFSSSGIVTLSGQWSFYPNQLIDDVSTVREKDKQTFIQVPGDWSYKLNDDQNNPYGYGTYHLRIKVNPEIEQTYKMQVSSARSSSALFINGEKYGGSGEVGPTEVGSKAWNVPFISSTIKPDEKGEIDILLQVTNFVDPRSSGLIRSIKFGFGKQITKEINISAMLQIVASVILFVHALFAFIVYFIGVRDKRLLYFSGVIICVSLINLSFSDEKILYQYISIDYRYTLKISTLLVILFFLMLVHAIYKQIENVSVHILPIVRGAYFLFIGVLLFLPIKYIDTFNNIMSIIILLTITVTAIALIRSSKEFTDSLWIFLSIIAIVSHLVWFFYLMSVGIKVVYYPFDLIISIICIAVVWFKHYYDLHEELLSLTEKLTVMDQVKDEFLANTSHELRNPLHSILNISEAVLQREKHSLQAESIADLDTVLTVSRRMSFMVNELLDIASIESGAPKLQLHPVSMKAVATGVIDMVAYSVEGKPIRLINKISNRITKVQGDENRLIQIMFNLVHNAIKFTPEGVVEIDGSEREGFVYISVKDTGIGMDEKTVQEIFDRYVQGSNANVVAEGGFGIGLYVSKQLIELHGGSLNVQSTLGKGTTFTFSIPVAKTKQVIIPKEDQEIKAFESKSYAQTTISDKPITEASLGQFERDFPRIIVVDDDKVNLRVIETVLSTETYEITSVLSGEEVLQLLDEREWDLVIADVMMPKMSGYELTRIIRSRFTMSELPVLLVTARSSQEDVEIGFLSGANDYIIKPVDAVELRSRVNALTSARQSMRERLQLESAWLQAQIKPHFLFNTLNSIIALSQFDTERMVEVLNSFSDVLRAKFNFENLDTLVPLDKELNLIESYMYIEQVRFGERLQIQFDIDEDVNTMIPTLSIQPLIENAINHGVMQRDVGGEIVLRVKETDQHVHITVADNGVGMDEGTLRKILAGTFTKKSGVGLININLRLKRLFGEGLVIESAIDEGTIISFKVPK